MASASVVCASRLIEPNDMAPVANRLTISEAGSTSSSGTGVRPHLLGRAQPEQPAQRHQLFVLFVDLAGELAILLWNVAAHRVLQVGHDRAPDMASPRSGRHIRRPRPARCGKTGALEKASWWRATVSVAISSARRLQPAWRCR
jgi:hypothetical protein